MDRDDAVPSEDRTLPQLVLPCFEVETYRPEELGWVLRKGTKRVWERPDGALYIFPEGGPQLIQKFVWKKETS